MFISRLCFTAIAVEMVLISVVVTTAQERRETASVFRFANIYGDHMVLQMKPFSSMVWGYGEIGQAVNVMLRNTAYRTEVVEGPGGLGWWKVTLEAQNAGGPYDITAASKVGNSSVTVSLHDVLFGDVWVCSGQSNMQFTMSQVVNVSEAIAEADEYPEIRLFTAAEVESPSTLYELKKVEQAWSVASSEAVNGGVWKYFSAVCWFYGKNLYDRLKRPIGLIATDWGGTPVEAWSSPDSLRQCNITGDRVEDVHMTLEELKIYGPESPDQHSVLYNAMIHPFLNMTIYGAIWYQGEANANRPFTYNCTFPAMIDDWRSKWFQGTGELTDRVFPFGFVQLSSNGNDATSIGGFPIIRWAQTANYGYVPNHRQKNIFMAVAMDLGNASSPFGSIHPNDKQDVGYRLALAGRAIAYGDVTPFSGPLVSDVVFTKESDSHWKATVKYREDTVGTGGITIRSKDGFEFYCVSPSNSIFVVAPITNAGFQTVDLIGSCPSTDHVVEGLRYGWREKTCDFKMCAVYSKDDGLPGPPFLWNAPEL